MREIGGYIEFETYGGRDFYEGAIALNCGRNCLAYLLEARTISKVYIPYFLCDSVRKVCLRMGVNWEYYHIDRAFRPVFKGDLAPDEYLYIVNYYGQLDQDMILSLKRRYGRVIVDQAQAFFERPLTGVDTLYTCRKFFGVADGAYLFTDAKLTRTLPLDTSGPRMAFLMGRFEEGANAYYPQYVENNRRFEQEPVKRMSRLTQNLLRAIDYDAVAKKRRDNFAMLDELLGEINALKVRADQGPYMYPLMLSNGGAVRKALQQRRIYVPILWPDVYQVCGPQDLEWQLAENVLPLPVDQRYGLEEMRCVAATVQELALRERE